MDAFADLAVETSDEQSTFPKKRSISTGTLSTAASTCSTCDQTCCQDLSICFEAKYEMLEDVLGEGMSGCVHAALCRETGRRMAVKSYFKEMSRMDLDHLHCEVEIHAALAHPNVVKLEDVFETKAGTILVMEQLEGGEVFDRLALRGRLAEIEAADVVEQTLQALAYLHAQKVAHRDIKIENLVYTEKGGRQVKVIDFGFAARVGSAGLTVQCGSFGSVAPEVMSGCPYDERCDLWSTGSIMYELLTGRPLLEGDEIEVMMQTRNFRNHRFGEAFGCLPKDAQDLLCALLHPDPSQRLSAKEALEHPWFVRIKHEEVQAAAQETSQLLAGRRGRCGLGLGPLLLGRERRRGL